MKNLQPEDSFTEDLTSCGCVRGAFPLLTGAEILTGVKQEVTFFYCLL